MIVRQKEARDWSKKFRGWHYRPEYIVTAENIPQSFGVTMVDCPLVFQLEGRDGFYLWVTGFNGKGYQTFLLESTDLLYWQYHSLSMGFGKNGAYDYGGVSFGGALFDHFTIESPRTLKKYNGLYHTLYGCYPKQNGYELRPGAQGLAVSEDGLVWRRFSENTPVLSVNGAKDWESDCIYQPFLLEEDGTFYNFYNAAKGDFEQTGIAVSNDLKDWTRYTENPVLRNGDTGSYDEVFCSDGKVFRDGDHWVMLYFGVGKGSAHIMAAFSRDLMHWTRDPEPLYPAGGNPSGIDSKFAHKISLIRNPVNDTYYMFYCAVGEKERAIGLITSNKC